MAQRASNAQDITPCTVASILYPEDGGRTLLQNIVPTTPYDDTLKLVMRDRPFPLAVLLEARHHGCFDVSASLVWKHTTPGTWAFNRGTLFPSAASVPSIAPDANSCVITGKGSYSLAVLQPSCNAHFDSHTKEKWATKYH